VISYFNVVFGRRLTSIWQQRQQAFAEIWLGFVTCWGSWQIPQTENNTGKQGRRYLNSWAVWEGGINSDHEHICLREFEDTEE